jgi:hypothetical protein
VLSAPRHHDSTDVEDEKLRSEQVTLFDTDDREYALANESQGWVVSKIKLNKECFFLYARRVEKREVFFSFDEVGSFITFEYVLLPVILNYIFNINKAFQVAHSFLIDTRNLSRVLYKCNSHELSLLRRCQDQSSQSLDLTVSGHDIEK